MIGHSGYLKLVPRSSPQDQGSQVNIRFRREQFGTLQGVGSYLTDVAGYVWVWGRLSRPLAWLDFDGQCPSSRIKSTMGDLHPSVPSDAASGPRNRWLPGMPVIGSYHFTTIWQLGPARCGRTDRAPRGNCDFMLLEGRQGITPECCSVVWIYSAYCWAKIWVRYRTPCIPC